VSRRCIERSGSAGPRRTLLALVVVAAASGCSGGGATLIDSSRSPIGPTAGQSGVFSATGSLGIGRDGPVVALLQDGRVLAAGGRRYGDSLDSAELFDPKRGEFRATGSMAAKRYQATATTLVDGRVLVVGGVVGSGPDAELFDPATGLFTATGPMVAQRELHTATRMTDGRVLIVGGYQVGAYLVGAEIFDPATGLFGPTGSMASAREGHTATLLPDGRVLVVGGDRGSTGGTQVYLADAEIYDPQSGKWAMTGSLQTARTSATATLLPDGRVLIAGGSGFQANGEELTMAAFASAEYFDPVEGQFTTAGSMTEVRAGHTATQLQSGKVLIVAGSADQMSAELFDPESGRFAATGSMGVPRFEHVAILLADGRVLVAGGSGTDEGRACETYRP
jgi:hypothetical protein